MAKVAEGSSTGDKIRILSNHLSLILKTNEQVQTSISGQLTSREYKERERGINAVKQVTYSALQICNNGCLRGAPHLQKPRGRGRGTCGELPGGVGTRNPASTQHKRINTFKINSGTGSCHLYKAKHEHEDK